MPSPSPDQPGCPPLAGQLVVFTGKLSSLGRRDARALVARLGGATADDVNAKTTMLVVGAEGFGPPPQASDAADTPEADGPAASRTSNKLKRAEVLNTQQASQIRIVSEEEFCRIAGVATPEALKRQYYAMRDLLARYRELREDHLRYLVKCGVIRPVLRTNADTFFAFPDLSAIKQANEGLMEGVSFRSVVRTLLASHQGQLTFDFRLDAAPAKILALRRQTATKVTPADETAPRDPIDTALAEAQALYERAIGLDSDFFEAHFNLGNIYHDLGRFPEAQGCYLEALRLNPYFADAHFYLAVTFEKMGQSQDARPHWRAYQQLAPQGEWVELAKEFSE